LEFRARAGAAPLKRGLHCGRAQRPGEFRARAGAAPLKPDAPHKPDFDGDSGMT